MTSNPKLETILQVVAQHFGIEAEAWALRGGGLNVRPRLIACALACEFLPDLSVEQAEHVFGVNLSFVRYAGGVWLKKVASSEVKAVAFQLRPRVKAALNSGFP